VDWAGLEPSNKWRYLPHLSLFFTSSKTFRLSNILFSVIGTQKDNFKKENYETLLSWRKKGD